MLSSYLRYLRIVLVSLSGLCYIIVLLSLTVIQDLYYGDFVFLGSAFIILFFLTEGVRHRITKKSDAPHLRS